MMGDVTVTNDIDKGEELAEKVTIGPKVVVPAQSKIFPHISCKFLDESERCVMLPLYNNETRKESIFRQRFPRYEPKIAVDVIKDQLLLQPLLPLRDDPKVEIHCQGSNLKIKSLLDVSADNSNLSNV